MTGTIALMLYGTTAVIAVYAALIALKGLWLGAEWAWGILVLRHRRLAP